MGLLIKADNNWFEATKNLYTNRLIEYVNYWSLSPGNKPVNLKDGAPIYIYTEPSVGDCIEIRAKGRFKSKIFDGDMGILKLDTDRVMTVEEAYKLYGPSNGSVSYGGFLNLLQNHAIGKNIIISDTYSLGVTIISDLEFTPQKYKLMNGTNNAPRFRYIANIEWYKMTLI